MSSGTAAPAPAPAPTDRRTIKRKLDDSILKKARAALGLPLESQEDDANDNPEPSLKWRKPRHNTAEGEAYIRNKEKRRREEEEAEKTSKVLSSVKKDDKKISKKKRNKKKKKAKSGNQTEPASVGSGPSGKNPESEKKHGMEAISYLQLWHSNRDHWKFEKLKQTWLLKNCLDVNLIDDTRFEILVEYIGSVKGGARKATLTEMQSIVTKYEMTEGGGESSEAGDKLQNYSSITSEMYERARQIIQMLVDDE